MPAASAPPGHTRPTRAAILSAAEALFAERGFAATRLEDVAERVGIRRASIVYYFRDKAELYDAVLGSVFGDLLARTETALATPGPLAARIEAAVSAWIDCIGARPSLARLLLREVADAGPDRAPALLRHTRGFFDVIGHLMETHRDDPLLADVAVDPVLLASTVAGGSVFFIAAMPALLPERGLDPVDGPRLEALREAVLRITRRLLHTRGPRPAAGRSPHGPRRS